MELDSRSSSAGRLGGRRGPATLAVILHVLLTAGICDQSEAQHPSGPVVEVGGGMARWAAYYQVECPGCPPEPRRLALGLVGRAGYAVGGLVDFGVEGRYVSGGGFHFGTLFATASISVGHGPFPWLRVGMGGYWEPEFCDVITGSSLVQCASTTVLGASASIGIRWALSERLSVGPEVGYLQRFPARGRFGILTGGVTARLR